MNWFARKKKRYFAIAGDATGALLAEISKGPQKQPVISALASAEGVAVIDKTCVHRLLSQVPETLQGQVSLALPLSYFATRNITLPIMPKEAIGLALPYHLAKAIDQPLRDVVYDWQTTQRQKNQQIITAYVFSRSTFEMLRQELAKKQLELTWFESDVSAACALLDRQNRLRDGEAALCLSIWANGISIGVHEDRVLTVVRAVSLKQPGTPYTETITRDELATAATAPQKPPPPDQGYIDDREAEAILLNFDILKQTEKTGGRQSLNLAASPALTMEKLPEHPPGPTAEASPVAWSDYLNQINLEIIRTRDYYASVVKGAPIRQVFVGGAGDFLAELQEIARISIEMNLEPLLRDEILPDKCPPSYGAICLGTGARW
ncbi:MAG: hypothetical protein A2521_05470 [Deltaproteobacteria bacterium RIFOXYD12_FULL_57_12]|nr:MAG: hypothetical protein A2521_05470 [Deltaproteobacteria bacterium RIFOXYD12_FULL_57_12]